jgi:acyl-coenzyme A synthetase/AMP-(fatty) acid ligase
VAVPHRSVRRFIAWANPYFGVTPADRHSGHSPLFFDLSTYDLFGTLAAGAQLHLVPVEANLLPHRLAAFIRDRALTQWFSVPSVLTHLAGVDAVRPADFPALRRLLWCGEVLPTVSLIHWMARLPQVTFTNLYGPTETTIASSYFTVPAIPDDPRAPIPIGRACGGEELLVLADDLRPCAEGEEGDLYIRGDGLTLGYWRDPDTTARAFRDLPAGRVYRTGDRARVGADCLVYFLGRADLQIKSRGYRIELGEIEAALGALPEVREAAAVALASEGFEGTRIACAYVLRTPQAATPAALRARLARTLPGYMLPSEWRELADLPRTGNGKLDRRALEARFREVAS